MRVGVMASISALCTMFMHYFYALHLCMFLFSFFAIVAFDTQKFISKVCLFSAQDYSPVFCKCVKCPKQIALLPKKKSMGGAAPQTPPGGGALAPPSPPPRRLSPACSGYQLKMAKTFW